MVSPAVIAGAAELAKKIKVPGLDKLFGSGKPAKNRRKSLKIAAKKLKKLAKYDPANAQHWLGLADELKGASVQLRQVNQYKYHQGPRPSWLSGTVQDARQVPPFVAAPVRAAARDEDIAAQSGTPANSQPQGGFDWGDWARDAIGGAVGGALEDVGLQPIPQPLPSPPPAALEDGGGFYGPPEPQTESSSGFLKSPMLLAGAAAAVLLVVVLARKG